jgi:hypothetical protein
MSWVASRACFKGGSSVRNSLAPDALMQRTSADTSVGTAGMSARATDQHAGFMPSSWRFRTLSPTSGISQ